MSKSPELWGFFCRAVPHLAFGAVALFAVSCGDSTNSARTCADVECGAYGSCQEDAGAMCVCHEGYTGDGCAECANGYEKNGSRCVSSEGMTSCDDNPCGANGTCDDSGGQVSCDCDEGYTGDDCSECDDGYHADPEDDAVCVVDAACGGDSCPANASCDDTGGIVTCTCNEGWDGAECGQCAAGYHDDGGDCVEDTECGASTCSNGTCDDSSGVPVCTCDPGYAGEYCDECAAGYHADGDACVADETCGPDSCPANAICDDTGGVVTCECNEGYTGDDCDECVPPLVLDETGACVEVVGCDPGLVLGEDGACTLECGGGTTLVDIATVDPAALPIPDGYQLVPPDSIVFPDGSTLTLERVGSLVCVPQGYTCEQYDPCTGSVGGNCVDDSGIPLCVCDEGYTGLLCADCDIGFHADATACVPDEACDVSSCSGRGTCDDSLGIVACTCDVGYGSADCGSCAVGYHVDGAGACVEDEGCEANTCAGHGACSVVSGLTACNCFTGYEGDACTECASGYHAVGDSCVLDEQCGSTTCSGEGTCDDTTGITVCTCNPGYAGTACQQCAAGYLRANNVCVPEVVTACTQNTCNGHGDCDDSSGEVACTCNSPYTGARCTACVAGYVLHPDGVCRVSVCGDRITDGRNGEECDDVPPECATDPNGAACQAGNEDSCVNACLFNVCGDGYSYIPPAQPVLLNAANSEKTTRPVARDRRGIAPPAKEPGEPCDDGPDNTEDCAYGQTNCLVCLPPGDSAECTVAQGVVRLCGDGVTDADFNEQCDDAEDNGHCYQASSGDVCVGACDSSCQTADLPAGHYCGDDSCDPEEDELSCTLDCGGECGTFSASPALPVPDLSTVMHTITVPPTAGVVADLDVALNISHTWVGDLIVTLTHGATTVTIVDRPGRSTSGAGCSQNNFSGIVLDDDGLGGAIEELCTANLTSPPSYTPSGALSAFNGMPVTGDWTLTVSDNAGADSGMLNSWSLNFTCGAQVPTR